MDPTDSVASQDESAPARLQEVVIAFQKALASAAQETAFAMRHTPAARFGLRSVYSVRSLEVELKAGLMVQRAPNGQMDEIRVQFDVPPEAASSLRFQVSSERMPEPLQEDSLFLIRPVTGEAEGARPIVDVHAPMTLSVTAALYSAVGEPRRAAPVELAAWQLARGEWQPCPAFPRGKHTTELLTGAEGAATADLRIRQTVEGRMLRVDATALSVEEGQAPLPALEPLYFNLISGQGGT